MRRFVGSHSPPTASDKTGPDPTYRSLLAVPLVTVPPIAIPAPDATHVPTPLASERNTNPAVGEVVNWKAVVRSNPTLSTAMLAVAPPDAVACSAILVDPVPVWVLEISAPNVVWVAVLLAPDVAIRNIFWVLDAAAVPVPVMSRAMPEDSAVVVIRTAVPAAVTSSIWSPLPVWAPEKLKWTNPLVTMPVELLLTNRLLPVWAALVLLTCRPTPVVRAVWLN